jgi:hypothetical protein
MLSHAPASARSRASLQQSKEEMQNTIFAVGDEPYLLWEEDVKDRTRDFLEGLDPEFFLHLLRVHAAAADHKRGSVAIRLALHHATETMFSFIGALLQAPDCPYAWVARCSNLELRDVVGRIAQGDQTLLSKFALDRIGWDTIAALVFNTLPDASRKHHAIEGFASVWGRLAADFLDEGVIGEYNAIKHGFRTRSGGFKVEIGHAVEDWQDATPEMTLLGESEFGATYYRVERLKGKGSRHLVSNNVAMNWSIQRDILLLQLAEQSIHNIVVRLKIANGFANEACQFHVPEPKNAYRRPFEFSPAVSSVSITSGIDPARLPEVSKDELLSRMRRELLPVSPTANADRSA